MKKIKDFLTVLLVCLSLVCNIGASAAFTGVNETENDQRENFLELDCHIVANTITVMGRTPQGSTPVTFWMQENDDRTRTVFVYEYKTDEMGDFALKFTIDPELYDENGNYDATLRVGGSKINIQRIDNIPLYSVDEMIGCKDAFAEIADVASFEQFFSDYREMLGVDGGYSETQLEILYLYYQKNLPAGDEELEEIIDILSVLSDKLTRHEKLVSDVSLAAIQGDASEIKRIIMSQNYADIIADNGYDFDFRTIINEADMWARMLTEDGYATFDEIQEAFLSARDAQFAVDKESGGIITDDCELNFMDIWKVKNVANAITVSGGIEVDYVVPINIHITGVEAGSMDEAEKIISFVDGKAVKPEPSSEHVEFSITFPLNTARFKDEVMGSMKVGAEGVNVHEFNINLYAQSEIDELLYEFKSINSVDDLENFIEDNKTMLEMTGGFSDEKLNVMYELYTEKDYSDVEDSLELAAKISELDDATTRILDFIDAINTASRSGRWGRIYEVVEMTYADAAECSEAYAELLELTKEAKSLKNINGVYKRMLGQKFTTVQDVNSSFEKAYIEQKEDEENITQSTGGSSGGGGGGSSFGGGKNFGMIVGEGVVVEEVTEITKEEWPAAPFTDIGGYDWAKTAIDGLRQKNIIKGDGNGIFRPGAAMTREEFLSLLLKTFDVEITEGEVPFSDVKSDAWYADTVATAYRLSVTNGMGDGRFGIGENITRADMVVLVMRLANSMDVNIPKIKAAKIFDDYTSIPLYAYEAVVAFQQADLVKGDENGNFNPLNDTTRAEAAVLFWNVYNAVF